MKNLLGHVEDELAFLGAYCQQFAEEYPAIAGELKLSGEPGGDPHIRYLTQAVAMLNARVTKKLGDDYPELTSSFLEMSAPHLLRQFPSCSIARFESNSESNNATTPTTIPRSTLLKTPSSSMRGQICKFSTIYPTHLGQPAVTSAIYIGTARAPTGVRLPADTSSEIAIKLTWPKGPTGIEQSILPKLRLFIDGESSFSSALLDALFLHTASCWIEDVQGEWHKLDKVPLAPVGLTPDEALLPFPAKSQAAFRLLTEYFCFPAKFSFFDIDLAAIGAALPAHGGQVRLHFILTGIHDDSQAARMLAPLSEKNLLAGCTPVINLFKQAACPIRLNYTTAHYPLIPDSLRASAYRIYNVDSVQMLKDGASGSHAIEFRPYYSLRHGENAARNSHYYILRRDDTLATTSPGHEHQMSFVDLDFNPVTSTSATVSIDLTCSNGDLPSECKFGAPGGDLAAEASIGDHRIRLMRRPTLPCPCPTGRNVQWKLASFLALQIDSLTEQSLPAMREILAMYDFSRSATSRRLIDGIVGFELAPARAWLRDKFGGATVHGIGVRLTIDESAFAGSGIHVFAQIMDQFLGMIVHLNSFTQLTVVSRESGKELIKCAPRNGNLILL